MLEPQGRLRWRPHREATARPVRRLDRDERVPSISWLRAANALATGSGRSDIRGPQIADSGHLAPGRGPIPFGLQMI